MPGQVGLARLATNVEAILHWFGYRLAVYAIAALAAASVFIVGVGIYRLFDTQISKVDTITKVPNPLLVPESPNDIPQDKKESIENDNLISGIQDNKTTSPLLSVTESRIELEIADQDNLKQIIGGKSNVSPGSKEYPESSIIGLMIRDKLDKPIGVVSAVNKFGDDNNWKVIVNLNSGSGEIYGKKILWILGKDDKLSYGVLLSGSREELGPR